MVAVEADELFTWKPSLHPNAAPTPPDKHGGPVEAEKASQCLCRKPQQHSWQPKKLGLPQNFIDKLAKEVQSRRQEREQEKTDRCKAGFTLRSNETSQGSFGEYTLEMPRSRGWRCGGGGRAGQCTEAEKELRETGTHRAQRTRTTSSTRYSAA